MAKGGRYLSKNRKVGQPGQTGKKKMATGWKVFLIILAVLLLLAAIAVVVAYQYLHGLLGNINRAEVIHQDVSAEDILDWATYNPDKYTEPEDNGGETQPEEETTAESQDPASQDAPGTPEDGESSEPVSDSAA